MEKKIMPNGTIVKLTSYTIEVANGLIKRRVILPDGSYGWAYDIELKPLQRSSTGDKQPDCLT